MMVTNLFQDILVIKKKIKKFKILFKKFDFPSDLILTINHIIKKNGGKLKIIGGGSRDLILNTPTSKDLDLVTDMEAKELVKCLDKEKIKYSKSGLKYGCIKLIIEKSIIEITSLRKDFNYDGRRPDIKHTKNWNVDANRRDFTINSIYIDLNGEIFDPHEGYDDLMKKKVKFIGDPKIRIIEDNLRILRFLRFSIKYANIIDENGFNACKKYKKKIRTLSYERRLEEIKKIIVLNKFKSFFKEISKYFFYDIFEANVYLKNFEKLVFIENILSNVSSMRRLKFFFQKKKRLDFFKAFSGKDLVRIKYKILIENYKFQNIKKMIFLHGKINVIDQVLFDYSNNKISSDDALKLNNFVEITKIPKFPISGNDIRKLGFKEGLEIGKKLNYLRKIWVNDNFSNTKKDLIKKILKSPGNLRRQ